MAPDSGAVPGGPGKAAVAASLRRVPDYSAKSPAVRSANSPTVGIADTRIPLHQVSYDPNCIPGACYNPSLPKHGRFAGYLRLEHGRGFYLPSVACLKCERISSAMRELSKSRFGTVWNDGEFLLSRSANAEASCPVLVLTPAVDQPAPTSIARLYISALLGDSSA